MTQMKVFEFAKEVGLETMTLMNKIREWKLPIKSHMVDLDDELIGQIRSKLDAEKAAAKPAKKAAVRKKAGVAAPPAKTEKAAPAVVAKEAEPAEEKKAPAKKAAVKKAVVAKAPAKKLASKADGAKSSGIVLRRKPTAAELAAQEAAELAAAEAAAAEAAAAAAAIVVEEVVEVPPEVVEPAAPVEVEAAPIAPVVPEPEKPKRPGRIEVVVPGQTPVARKNIVGRMDLSRVKEKEAQFRSERPGGPRQGGFAPRPGFQSRPGFQQRPGGPGPRPVGVGPRPDRNATTSTIPGKEVRVPRSGAQRNIRAGFASSAQLESEAAEAEKKKRGAAGEEENLTFSATEFRKREMIFQPKKKKGLLSRDARSTELTTPAAHKRVVKVFGTMTVGDLAQNMGVKSAQLTKVLLTNGVQATENTPLDFDTVALIVPEFQFEA